MLPWQMKSIFIIVLFLLVLPRNVLPRLSSRSRQSQNARLCKHIGTLRSLLRVFCKGLRCYGKMLWNYRLWQIRARLSMLLLPASSKISSRKGRVTTKDFIRHPYSTSVYTNNSIFDVYHIVFQLLPYYVILALLTDDTQICALIPLSHIPYLSP